MRIALLSVLIMWASVCVADHHHHGRGGISFGIALPGAYYDDSYYDEGPYYNNPYYDPYYGGYYGPYDNGGYVEFYGRGGRGYHHHHHHH